MFKVSPGNLSFVVAAVVCFGFVFAVSVAQEANQETKTSQPAVAKSAEVPIASTQTTSKVSVTTSKITPTPISPFIANGIDWLIKAQHDDGGWGGGSHAAQNIKDPKAVPSDPATTSFTTMALIRAGSTPTSGENSKAIRKALHYLVSTVEKASDDGPRITDMKGTQPQQKLGGLIDTTMTTQCLARVIKEMNKDDKLYARVDRALDKCIAKLEKSQKEDGSWNVAGGWAPVLQSSSGQTALELAKVAGKNVSGDALNRAIDYQTANVDISGKASGARMGGVTGGIARSGKIAGIAGGGVSAGVELYSFSTGQRGNASKARFADEAVKKAKREGKIDESEAVSEETLQKLGLNQKDAKTYNDAFVQNSNQIQRLGDKKLLGGFGNNGGEEFVSFLLTSESMIIAGGDEWTKWNDKMHGMLKKIQNQDGSWSGHHCITNPTFCTAAVVQCLLADHDADLLIEIAEQTLKASSDQKVSDASAGEPGGKTETSLPADTAPATTPADKPAKVELKKVGSSKG